MDIKEKQKDNNFRHPWEIARKKIINSFILKYTSNAINNGMYNILDIGSGDNYLSENFSKKYPKSQFYCIDIEYSQKIIEEMKPKSNSSNIHLFDRVDSLLEKKNNICFNLILLLDILEHIEDDMTFLQNILSYNTIYSNDSFLFITVPSFQMLFTNHDDFLGHYRRYNLKFLKKLIQDAGLIEIDSGYFFFSLLPVRIMQKIFNKILKNEKKNEKGIGNWSNNNFFTNTITLLLFLDFKISQFLKKIKITIPGLSAYIICKKKHV